MYTVAQPVNLQKFRQWVDVKLEEWGEDFKFVPEHIARQPRLKDTAITFLQEYKGTFEFIIDVQRYYYDTGDISDGQAKGVLNCILADVRRSKRFRKAQQSPNEFTIDASRDDIVEQAVQNGRYTVVFNGRDDDYLTIKLSDCKFGDLPKGTQVASYLYGPDNGRDYIRFAFVLGKEMRVWSRFHDTGRVIAALRTLLESDDDQVREYGHSYALKSNNCYRCGRALTVPVSIHRGLGPVCAGIIGGEE